MEVLAFEGLPGESVDEIKLDDVPLNVPAQMRVTLRSMSEKHYRCARLAAMDRQACRAGIDDSLQHLVTAGWHLKLHKLSISPAALQSVEKLQT